MNQLHLFSSPQEKGSREWSTFDPVKPSHTGMFRVLTPRKAEEPRYGNVVHIKRYHQPLFLKGA